MPWSGEQQVADRVNDSPGWGGFTKGWAFDASVTLPVVGKITSPSGLGWAAWGLKRTTARFWFVGSSVFPSCWRQESSLAFRCSKQTARPVEVQTVGSAVTWPSTSGRSHWSAAHRWEAGLKIDISPLVMPQPPPDCRVGACHGSLQSYPRWMILDGLSFSSSDAPVWW